MSGPDTPEPHRSAQLPVTTPDEPVSVEHKATESSVRARAKYLITLGGSFTPVVKPDPEVDPATFAPGFIE